MITASLTKDINSSNEMFRSHALRALCRICEVCFLLECWGSETPRTLTRVHAHSRPC
jgi:hypothetical protein